MENQTTTDSAQTGAKETPVRSPKICRVAELHHHREYTEEALELAQLMAQQFGVDDFTVTSNNQEVASFEDILKNEKNGRWEANRTVRLQPMTNGQIRKLPVGALLYWPDFHWYDFNVNTEGGCYFIILDKDSDEFTVEPIGWFRDFLRDEHDSASLFFDVTFLVGAELRRVA